MNFPLTGPDLLYGFAHRFCRPRRTATDLAPERPGSIFHSALRFFKIFFANGSLISVCRGTASIAPFFGLIQSECEAPSLFR